MDNAREALDSDLTLGELRNRVDAWYRDLLTVASLETDAALVRIATIEAEVMFARTQALRSSVRAMTSAVGRELDPLLATLGNQAKLLLRANHLRRGRQP